MACPVCGLGIACRCRPEGRSACGDGILETAVLTKDAPALDRLLHPDLVYSHSDGKAQTKADILKSLPNSQSIEFGDDTTVRIYGNTALVKGTIKIDANHLSVLQVWLKGPKGWQLVARHSTKLNPTP
jgi:hypothetical protein